MVGFIVSVEAFQKPTVWAEKDQGIARYVVVGEV